MTYLLGIVLVQFVFSFLASAAFAIIINVPRRSLVACGLTGSVSWMLYWVIVEVFSGNAALGSLIGAVGAVGVAAVSYLFSKILKMPVTIFNIPGIVPLVPGGLAYQAVRNIVIGNYEKGAYFTVQAVMIAGAIALGLVASEVFNQNIRSFREKRESLGFIRRKRNKIKK
ncbi:threonine/serine exporter family protein [Enterococcus sp. AZ129]|uniref:threonine/serine exporter family protein n=1 Tax=unclassified Enterococcus TaxID=2608891 RepID=UPI003F6839A6